MNDGWYKAMDKGEDPKRNGLKEWVADNPKTFAGICVGLAFALLYVVSID